MHLPAEVVLIEDGEPIAIGVAITEVDGNGASLETEHSLQAGQRIIVKFQGVEKDLFGLFSFDEAISHSAIDIRVKGEIRLVQALGDRFLVKVAFLGPFRFSKTGSF